MFKTSEGGMSRMAMSWDMKNAHGEQGRVYGQKPHNDKINGARPPLPPGVGGGGHGGSHGQRVHVRDCEVLFGTENVNVLFPIFSLKCVV